MTAFAKQGYWHQLFACKENCRVSIGIVLHKLPYKCLSSVWIPSLLLLPASYITPLVALDKGALEGNEEKDWALSTAMMLTSTL